MRQIWVIAQNTIKALIRKKDFYVFLILLLVLLVWQGSQSFFGVGDMSRYLKDIGFSCIWLFSLIISVTFSAKQVPEEIDRRTIYPLLAKPISRPQFIIGRFLGSVLASSAAYSVFYLVFYSSALFKGEGISPMLVLQSYVLGICFLSLVCAISMFLSGFLTLSAAIIFSFIIYFCIVWFVDVLRAAALHSAGLKSAISNIIYYIIPHYEFYDLRVRLVHSWEPLPTWIFFVIILYTAIYTSIMLSFSYFSMRKRFL